MRKKYDNQLKLIYCLGLEKLIIDEEIRKIIPKSTASTWRHLEKDSILNSEYSDEIRETILKFADTKFQLKKRERQLLFVQARFKHFLVEILGENEYHKLLKKNKAKLIKTISNCSSIIESEILLKLLNLNPKTYNSWKAEIKFFCSSSPLHICARLKPQQLTMNEVCTMRRLLTDPNRSHWSISAIHGDAFKNGQLNISRASYYRYNRYFKFRIKQETGKRPHTNH